MNLKILAFLLLISISIQTENEYLYRQVTIVTEDHSYQNYHLQFFMDVIIENHEFQYLEKADQVARIFDNKFEGNVEFAVTGFYKIYKGVKRTDWATAYQLSSNKDPQDLQKFGDRTLALFIKENELHFCTYDLNTQNKNLCKSINFEDYEEGKWALIYHSYSRIQQKVYAFVQFSGHESHEIHFDKVGHEPSNYYIFQGGQSFQYKNFPGKIIGQTFFSGAGNYRECGFDLLWSQLIIIERIYIYEVLIIYDIDYEDENDGVIRKFENEFEKTQEFAIYGWFKISKKISRKNWSTAYHFNGNQKVQDFAEFGDRTLAFFIIENRLHFCTYDINSNDKNVYEDHSITKEHEDVWMYVYQAYSPTLQKMFIYIQFYKLKEATLFRSGLKHQYTHVYTLFVGQSFKYNKWPGQIRGLQLCAGVGCYREKDFQLVWKYFETIYHIQVITVIEEEIDYDDEDEEKPKDPIVQQFYEEQFAGVQEFGIEGWFRISVASNRKNWATAYHLNTNQKPQDLEDFGDRTLSFFVINNTLHFPTYDLNTSNKNLYKNVEFSNDLEGVWCFIYHGYSPKKQKAYVFTQFYKQQSKVLEFMNVRHREAFFVTLYVGKSFQYNKFPGVIRNLKFAGGHGAYREIDSVNWDYITHNKYGQSSNVVVIDVDFVEEENKGGVTQVFNKFQGIQEFGIYGWFKLKIGVDRSNWATAYHFNSNQNPQDLADFGDRTLSMFVINNMYHFPTYDLKTQNKNLYQNVEFSAEDEGVWCFVYHGYSPIKKKAYVFTQFQGKKAQVLEFFHVVHRDSNVYKLFVGKSFAYQSYPGRIVQLKLDGGDGAYREIDTVDWNLVPSDVEYSYTQILVVEDIDLGDDMDAKPVAKVFEGQYNGIQEFGIEGWFRLKPNANRSNWATSYHFNGNKNPQDFEDFGDRTLSMFVINNILHFPTYDLITKDKNLFKNIEFEKEDEGVWCFIYHGYSPYLRKAYVFTQFQNKNSKILEFMKVLHRDSRYYHLFVGQSFKYQNFPGRINQLKLAAGKGAYREISSVDWRNIPKDVTYQVIEVVVVKDHDFEDDDKNQVQQTFNNKFNGIQEFGIEGWFKLKVGVDRGDWATGYHFGSNQIPQDYAQFGDRTLSMFVINNMYHFPTYDLKTQNKNLYKNVEFTKEDEGVWCFIYHGYSPIKQKAYVFTQFQGKNPAILHFLEVYHHASFYYHLFVGQSFQYRNYPGRIAKLKLSAGTGAYRELEAITEWSGVPKEIDFPYFEEIVLDDGEGDNVIVKKQYTNLQGVQELSIQGWFKLNASANRSSWATGYHLNSNKVPQDLAVFGDRTLALFIINKSYHLVTYDMRRQNTNYYQNIDFTQEEEQKWAFIYFGYSPIKSKAYVFSQFQGSAAKTLEYLDVKHQNSIIYNLFVGKSFNYLHFPGRIVGLKFAAGNGAYREYGFDDNNPIVSKTIKKSIRIQHDVVDYFNQVIIQEEKQFDYQNDQKQQVLQVYTQFAGVQEFGISGWFKLTKGVQRSQWATGYHFNSNENPQDLADFGDRTLSMFVIEYSYHFPTYDLNTGNRNLYKNVQFTNDNEGVWCFIYHGYSPDKQKAYVFTQFQSKEPVALHFQDVKHRDSNFYSLFVGQSFGYRNFPGKISQLKFEGGKGAYKEFTTVNNYDGGQNQGNNKSIYVTNNNEVNKSIQMNIEQTDNRSIAQEYHEQQQLVQNDQQKKLKNEVQNDSQSDENTQFMVQNILKKEQKEQEGKRMLRFSDKFKKQSSHKHK